MPVSVDTLLLDRLHCIAKIHGAGEADLTEMQDIIDGIRGTLVVKVGIEDPDAQLLVKLHRERNRAIDDHIVHLFAEYPHLRNTWQSLSAITDEKIRTLTKLHWLAGLLESDQQLRDILEAHMCEEKKTRVVRRLRRKIEEQCSVAESV